MSEAGPAVTAREHGDNGQSPLQPLQSSDRSPASVSAAGGKEYVPPRRSTPGKIAAALCAAVAIMEAGILEPFQTLARVQKLDVAEICCTRDSPIT